ncbi:MAG: acyl-CoA dehydrogenase [Bergeyella sp.]|nr:acyl-CoA dehydrogenase [Bergeyella sp.]
MDFTLSPEHLMIQQAARDFARTELLPGVIERDRTQTFPHEAVKKMGSLGFMGMMVSPKYGGAGLDAVSYVVAIEELAKVDASAAVVMSVNNSLVCAGLEKYGSEEQKQKYLFPLARGEVVGAFALSEPEAGSDSASQKTTAEDMGNYYLLNGTKNWITNGSSATYYIVIAQSNPKKKHKGINAFIIERGWKGFQVGAKEDKLGIRGSDTHTLLFNDVKVPKSNRIGGEGLGFVFAMDTLNGGRIGISAQALGIAAGAYEIALNYAKTRRTFGKEIIRHQAIGFKLADMHVNIAAARMLVYKAAAEKDRGLDISESGAMAKLYASKVAMETTTEAIQVLGGCGYVKEYHVERMFRDAKITQIYEGTSEIQKIVISRALLK